MNLSRTEQAHESIGRDPRAARDRKMLSGLLDFIEGKTGLRKGHIFAANVAILASILMIGYGSNILCDLIGFAYPAYKSIKAIESYSKEDDVTWLMYWVVHSIFTLLEYFTDYFMSWITFYWLIKCLFLIFCMAPGPNNGSLLIYRVAILPLFHKYRSSIDQGIETVSILGVEMADEALETAQDIISGKVAEVVNTAINDALKEHKDGLKSLGGRAASS